MTTQAYIDENKTELFKKGDKVVMHTCHESTLQIYKDKVWTCLTDSFLARDKSEVVFLENFSGYFSAEFLKIVDLTTLKDLLKPFGNLETCEEIEGKFHIKITDGFSINAVSTFDLMKIISDAIGDKYSVIHKLQTDDNLFHYILKSK